MVDERLFRWIDIVVGGAGGGREVRCIVSEIGLLLVPKVRRDVVGERAEGEVDDFLLRHRSECLSLDSYPFGRFDCLHDEAWDLMLEVEAIGLEQEEQEERVEEQRRFNQKIGSDLGQGVI